MKFDGLEMGETPLTTKVKKSFNGVVTVKSKGYVKKDFQMQKRFNVISIFNLGNFVAWGIDYLTGAINKFDKAGYDVNLEKDSNTRWCCVPVKKTLPWPSPSGGFFIFSAFLVILRRSLIAFSPSH